MSLSRVVMAWFERDLMGRVVPMPSDATTWATKLGWPHAHKGRDEATAGGRRVRGQSETEPATDVAPTLTLPTATVDWSPLVGGSENLHSTEPAAALALPADVERAITHRYCLVREIGRGGFGVVFLAYDRELHRQVALKVASRGEGRSVEDLLEEGRKVAQLDHPNIVPVYDCGRINDRTIFIVSKYIDGGSLANRLALRRLSIDEAIGFAEQVAGALAHAHERGLIHRDLKPSNILLDAADRVFVADFGLAIRTMDRSDRACIEGSPLYMSPEQAGGKSRLVDRRTDVFSFGAILYEMLTGKRPYGRRRFVQDEVDLVPPAAHEVCGEVPEELSRICAKAMAREPGDRYASAWELARELKAWQASLSKCRVWKRLLVASLVLLALLAAAWALSSFVARAGTSSGGGGSAAPIVVPDTLDRRVATWVLKLGGQIDVEDYHPPRIVRLDQLPPTPFTVKAITLLNLRAVGDAEVKTLVGLEDLLYLHLSGTRITDGCGPDLAQLGSLRYLWLGWGQFGDRGLMALADLKNLEHLNLEHSNVTDAGVLAAVGSPNLNVLYLSETRITDDGLARLHTLPNLGELYLNQTAITDAAVAHLLKIKTLRRLEVAGTGLSAEAVARLRAGLAGCLVVE